VLRRIVWLLIAFPVGLLLVMLAVANRHDVALVLDPFQPEAPALSFVMPFYVFLFGTLIIGVLLGGFATWVSQGHWRRNARRQAREAARWHGEADRLARERDLQAAANAKQLAVASQ